MLALIIVFVYRSLPVLRKFFILSFYALENTLLFCFHFICFAFVLVISYGFLYVCFFQTHVLILRFSLALISMIIFYLSFFIITFVKTKALGLVFDKRDFFFKLLSRYLFFLFLSSINYFIYMFLPNKYFILFIFLQLLFITNILKILSNTWTPVIKNSSFFNLTFRFFNIAPLLILSEAAVPGGSYFVFQGFLGFLSISAISSPRISTSVFVMNTHTRAFSGTSTAFLDKKDLMSLYTDVIPVTSIVNASLEGNRDLYTFLMRRHKVPTRLGINLGAS